jgi:outer membrane lipoprotein-sorting protein
MMKKSIALLSGMIITGAGLIAQDQAGSILDKVSKELQSHEIIQADFSFSLENKEFDIFDSYDGSLLMQADKYRLSIMGMLVISNGDMMWVYTEEFNEVNIMDPDESEFFNPQSIFNIYKEDFKLEYLGKADGMENIKLVPLEDNSNYSHLLLKTDATTFRIREVRYEGLDGNNYIIKIKDFLTDVKVDDSFFIFDKSKYPGVEIFDLR